MVKLYGVVHGYQEQTLLGPGEEMLIQPSHSFLTHLSRLPKGTKVGIEWFEKCPDLEPPFKRPESDDKYWQTLVLLCRTMEHESFFLEDAKVLSIYMQASKEKYRLDSEEIYYEEGESDFDYHIKLCTLNDKRYKAEMMARNIHEIERDNSLLETIKSKGVHAAIVGKGHSDYWMQRQLDGRGNDGIVFEDYSADVLVSNGRFFESEFVENEKPDKKIVWMRIGLERVVSLMKTGRLTEKTPDYVGIWDVVDPSRGYFEMFIEKNDNGKVSGTIEDCIGSAVFEGTMSGEEFNFLKIYNEHSPDVTHPEIQYKLKRDALAKGGFYGYFYVEGFGTAVYIAQVAKENPLELTARWHRAVTQGEQGQEKQLELGF